MIFETSLQVSMTSPTDNDGFIRGNGTVADGERDST